MRIQADWRDNSLNLDTVIKTNAIDLHFNIAHIKNPLPLQPFKTLALAQNKMELNQKHQSTFYLIGSLLFCLGFLFMLTNLYCLFTYSNFIGTGHTDLIARLGFLTVATGILYFPIVVIPLFTLTWISKRMQKIKTNSVWVGSLYGLIIIGALLYTLALSSLFFLFKYNWILGLVFILVSVVMFWNQLIFSKAKRSRP